ncbi:MAG: methyltransferase domain-containing protein [Clostridia bacterium]|nr:methyltransferase domain-containing protein [Clostridia bacterium]
MKDATCMPQYPAKKFMSKTHEMLEAQLLYAGIELGVFNLLESFVTLEEIEKGTGYHKRNLELLLNALTAIGFIEKQSDAYRNLPETNFYLNQANGMYLGDHILYWRDMTSLDNLTHLVQNGPGKKQFKDENGSDFFDFRSMGQGARTAMYLGQIQNFISAIERFYAKEQQIKAFDLGCGSGIMAIELVKNFSGARATVFDQAHVIELTKEVICEYGVGDKVQTKQGNFNGYTFEESYDLIIASGVFDFVSDLKPMLLKLKDALEEDGHIYIGTHGINSDFTGPKPYILGWLSSHLNGLDILKPDPLIREALLDVGLEIVFEDEMGLRYIVRKRKTC